MHMPTTRTEQQAFCETLVAAGLAPDPISKRDDGWYVYWLVDWTPVLFSLDNFSHETPCIWRPWEDIRAVWHLVLRFGLHMYPEPNDSALWRVERVSVPFDPYSDSLCRVSHNGEAAEIPAMVCAVSLQLQAQENPPHA